MRTWIRASTIKSIGIAQKIRLDLTNIKEYTNASGEANIRYKNKSGIGGTMSGYRPIERGRLWRETKAEDVGLEMMPLGTMAESVHVVVRDSGNFSPLTILMAEATNIESK